MKTSRKWIAPMVSLLAVALVHCEETKPAPAAATSAPTATTPAATAKATAAATATATEEKKPEGEAAPSGSAEGSASAGAIPEIPEGRSKPPTVAEWRDAATINTQDANSQPEGCFMKIVREWLKVNCEGKVTEVTDMEEFGTENADYFQSVTPGKSADFVVRVRKGKTMKLKILRSEKGNASLFVNWPQTADKPTIVALGRSN